MSKVEYDDYTQKDKVPVWGPHVKYSDQLANGDADDNKELEDEDDPHDIIVDDDGFVNQWQHDPKKLAEWARAHHVSTQQAAQLLAKKQQMLAQQKSQQEALAQAEAKAQAEHQAEMAAIWDRTVKYSDTLANGDADDDRELEDEDDPDDFIADDDGFVNQWKIDPEKLGDYKWAAKMKKFQQNLDSSSGRAPQPAPKPAAKPAAKTAAKPAAKPAPAALKGKKASLMQST